MGNRKAADTEDPLKKLVDSASAEVLRKLVAHLCGGALNRPAARGEEDWRRQVRRECFEFLKENVILPSSAKAGAEAVFSLWDELRPDLEDLDEYGGGDYDTEDHVGSFLYELGEKLLELEVPREDRRALLDEVLPFIRSGNAGMDDVLYDVAYAACRDEEDWRDLAQRLESLGKDWPMDRARRIYRNIGDREKYLALRSRRMQYGVDYHDLATFYWEAGERKKALEVAREGLRKATGRMDELRAFVAEQAQESGDRKGYLELQFEQATDRLTAKGYQEFRAMCTEEEWAHYEPRMLARLEEACPGVRLKIHMIREEYEAAIALVSKMRYPYEPFGGEDILDIAARLEKRYPDQVLAFYMKGLGDLNQIGDRKTYAHRAKVMLKVRHMWVDVMKAPEKWKEFARKVKMANQKRPAFQQEFAKAIRDWKEL